METLGGGGGGGAVSQGRLHGRAWAAFQRKRILDRQRGNEENSKDGENSLRPMITSPIRSRTPSDSFFSLNSAPILA